MASFTGEIEAFKPGNVSVYADGHNMTVADFITSANLVAPIICDKRLPAGERIYQSIKATREAVACNTNLGMVLLFVPIILAAEQCKDMSRPVLQHQLKQVMASFTEDDAAQLFSAISLAAPGGLGTPNEYDVNHAPDCSVLTAMRSAASRDLIALQYVSDFKAVLDIGPRVIKHFAKRWNSVEWATVASYLSYLAKFNDSHIERKFGHNVANDIRKKGEDVLTQFASLPDPEIATDMLGRLDSELKEKRINPGTSADLTAASLLVYNLCELEPV